MLSVEGLPGLRLARRSWPAAALAVGRSKWGSSEHSRLGRLLLYGVLVSSDSEEKPAADRKATAHKRRRQKPRCPGREE